VRVVGPACGPGTRSLRRVSDDEGRIGRQAEADGCTGVEEIQAILRSRRGGAAFLQSGREVTQVSST
jgi:hypothetical protein